METVAFYSYKGGVGRTLLVANTAQFLAMSGRHVVALDLDLEAPGLHQKLGSREVMRQASAGTLRGAVDELLDILEKDFSERNPTIAVEEVNLPTGTTGSLRLIPAGAAPSPRYWASLERLNNVLRTRSPMDGLPAAILELQTRIEKELKPKPDFLLIDSRTGITELGGLATSLLADRVVCLTTTAPESVEGTKVVANALRKAPRLASQKALEVESLITRVVNEDSPNVLRVKKELDEISGSIHILPHDPEIADEERVLYAGSFQPKEGSSARIPQLLLFTASLNWMKKSFIGDKEEAKATGHEEEAETAGRRMEEVQRAWQELTATEQRYRRGYGSRAHWPLDQLRKLVRFGRGKKSRQADIVAYDSTRDDAKPLMVIEYIEGEDRDAVAKWWLEESNPSYRDRPQIVVLLSNSTGTDGPIRVVSRAHSSDRWWNRLPMPYDFDALTDPADNSLDALLDAVHRCSKDNLFHASLDYLNRIVAEWVRCTAVGLHGGMPWKPHVAKKIVDALAREHDVDIARRILHAAFGDPRHREDWVSSDDDGLIDQLHAELFSPLLWRVPPEAAISVIGDRKFAGLHGPGAGPIAIGLLARNTLGFCYDPDSTFRVEGQRVLDRIAWRSESHPELRDAFIDAYGEAAFAEQAVPLYPGLTGAFTHIEISFEMTSDMPPIATPIRMEGRRNELRHEPVDLRRLVSELIAVRSLVTSGLLGNYKPNLGRVLLYSLAIKDCADKLALQPRHVGSVVLIHETLHALMHLGRDLDGRMWTEFALPDASSPLFEPSWFHETLTQYFTYQHILRLRDPALLHAFETMSAKSMPQYRAWERIRNLPIEDARSWLMSVRRGVAPHPLQLVIHGSQDMS